MKWLGNFPLFNVSSDDPLGRENDAQALPSTTYESFRSNTLGKLMTKVICSVATSVDGFIDDTTSQRLVLSSKEDFDDVYRLRARCDAILVGAGTLRADNPSLVTRSEGLVQWRQERGLPPDPIKITVTTSGRLDRDLRFFTTGKGTKIIYCPDSSAAALNRQLGDVAVVVTLGEVVTARKINSDLSARQIDTVMVEGGSGIHTMFFAEDQVDELRLAIAPFFVGSSAAPRFVKPARFPFSQDRRMKIDSVKTFGDTVVIYYKLRAQSEDDHNNSPGRERVGPFKAIHLNKQMVR